MVPRSEALFLYNVLGIVDICIQTIHHLDSISAILIIKQIIQTILIKI